MKERKYIMRGDLETIARTDPQAAKELLMKYELRYPTDTWPGKFIKKHAEYWESLVRGEEA